jgi:serine phosphatase RsbU (regulator of sigma subunit)
MMFGEDKLADACARWAGVPIEQMVEQVFREVDQFIVGESQRDDQAMLALEVTE